MFTVVEMPVTFSKRTYAEYTTTFWVVWDGWDNQFSAQWRSLDEACRDAALKESFRRDAEQYKVSARVASVCL